MTARTDVSFGATVMGTESKLGEIHRVIVDAYSDTVTDLVVKHGFVFGGECMVPLSYVGRVDADGTVHVTLDERAFAAMEGFTDAHFHAPDPSYLGPPEFAKGQFLLNTAVVGGATMGGMAGKPGGYPGGEETSPDALARPTLSPGTPILDRDGEEIGEVHELEFEALGGVPQRLVMHRGRLFHTDTELTISWVENLSDAGVVLNVARAWRSSGPSQSMLLPRRTDHGAKSSPRAMPRTGLDGYLYPNPYRTRHGGERGLQYNTI